MAAKAQTMRSAFLCSSCSKRQAASIFQQLTRSFSQHAAARATPTPLPDNADIQQQSGLRDLELSLAHTKLQIREATQRRAPLKGSLRYRWAVSTNQGIQFEQLPYQCFQEARKVLGEHRNEILQKIEVMRSRIQQQTQKSTNTDAEARSKQHAILELDKKLEALKIEADINDPLVKRRFENGEGDMNKPIYRYLADQNWRDYRRKLVNQRLETMSVVPDVIDKVDLVAAVDISFPGAKVQPGDFVQSIESQRPPRLNIQVFDAGPRFVSVVIVDPDVPNFETDNFCYRLHGVYVNIKVSPTDGVIDLAEIDKNAESTLLPWLPPHAHKDGPYHRLAVFVIEHHERQPLDAADIKTWLSRDNVNMRTILHKTRSKVRGATMFRTQWDDGMAEVMTKHNLPGLDIQMKRKPAESLPYKPRDTRRMRG